MDLGPLTLDNVALGVRVEPPAATAAAVANDLFGRQEDEFSTCGYWSFSNREFPFAPYRCRESECTTTGRFHGCDRGFVTTCYDSTDDKCTAGASGLPSLEKCCTNSGGLNCLTILKSDDGDWYTGFDCGGGRSGTQWVSVTPIEATATITEGDETTTLVQSTEVSTTDAGTDAEESSEAEGDDDSNDNENGSDSSSGSGDDGGGGSDTPIGAIVGGTIGGVALIALVGFAFWFIRIYKRKQEMKEKNVESNSGYPNQYNYQSSPGYDTTPAKTPDPGYQYYGGSTMATGGVSDGGGGGYTISEMDGAHRGTEPAELNAVPTVELQGDFDRSR